jgi:exopolysaccharide biosynthesis polyprenyl glycosylphosphotransferase
VPALDVSPHGVLGRRAASPAPAAVPVRSTVAFPLAGLSSAGSYPRFELPTGRTLRPSRIALSLALTVKRMMDVGISVLAIVAFAPLMLAAALAVKLTSPGPVLFRQERVGLNARAFRVVKFRSMTLGAEREVAELMASNGGYVPFYKASNDPRVTRVGRFLRRTSIDELPQFFNVLRGEMSLVGPRPQVEAEVEQYAFVHNRRLLVKPGITGLWQVSGRSDLAWSDAVRLDMRYVDEWSLRSDVRIMVKTVKVVLSLRGAY